ncbi:ethylene-responsive transcription factor RAP2-11-like [Brachypodium distachyon]|uniref:AP2/ERF domain-containing protein n=1 Tax=Brachypodium distachyon TaxID=15368 RepID=A0A0Q3H6C1_BRADI|nr:ethylene-responsive transcription factor RAP2-11-like [Brachypodium distachyon]KQK18045.1 hypothetical protein BRADI_1g38238v3 [Brachypodium distachyon]|eukprot:XP_024313313.1 ethylene-responsive transcription factor RAP2-11-like [Brachypodium distachyon]
MELHFQHPQPQECQQPAKGVRRSSSSTSSSSSKCKFVGVRQRPSGRWVAEIKDTTHKIRVWLGTFETAEDAARAYDEAACLLRGSNTRTNFAVASSPAPASPQQPDSPLASRIRTLLTHKKLKKHHTAPRSPVAFTPPYAGNRNASAGNSNGGSASSSISFAVSGNGVDLARHAPNPCSHQRVAEESYRTCQLINHFDHPPSWAAALNPAAPPVAGSNAHCPEMPQGRMKAEKQEGSASASPDGAAAMSTGFARAQQQVDGFDIGNDPCDSLWDLPPICQLSCRSLMY